MKVSHYIKQTTSKGLALFSDQFIKKGTIIYDGTHESKLKFTSYNEIHNFTLNMNQKEKEKCISFIYGYKNLVILLMKHLYINHDFQPNSKSNGKDYNILRAIHDIKPNQEITENYLEYDSPEWFNKFCDENQLMNSYKFSKSLEQKSQLLKPILQNALKKNKQLYLKE